jgi:putative membrane protein
MNEVATPAPPRERARPGSDELRALLAMERTLLAWVRTGLALMGFGFLVAKFGLFLREIADVKGLPPTGSPTWSLWIGTALLALGIAVNVLAATQHARLIADTFPGGVPGPRRFPLAIALCLALSALGLAMVAYLISIR